MGAPDWQRVKDVFALSLKQAEERRSDFLSVACADDPVLRAEVESLLNAYDEPESLLEQGDFAVASLVGAEEDSGCEGKVFGNYKIIREIGRGGMGTVYLGERADAEYRKLVAIKVVRRGMDSEDIMRRFRNERQILAGLDHPNIARLIDGGTTDTGLPYLVMEYVEGVPVTQHCDRQRLTTNQRLELFRHVCEAVQHAHQNLVVHRDLKPSNILITPDGTPKLLDFGIAKVFNPELSVLSTEQTRAELRVLTPDYASPEQLRGEKLTTATDVYSLGVVLYDLLTGHPPYRITNAPPHELTRVICEQEPTKPSTAVSRVEVLNRGETEPQTSITPESVSRARDTQPDKLRRRLSGDLDNIVLMALRKEPHRRYQSVAQFSEDIRRHLEGLPVVAHKDTFRYRAVKFLHRNRIGAAAAALVLLTLVGGIVATAWQARRAERERARAEQRFRDVRALANSFMFEFHDAIQNLPGSTPAREFVVRRALEYLDRLAGEAGGDSSLQRELAAAYQKLGDAQGNPARPNLGDTRGAIASYGKALAIREALLASGDSETRREMANLLYGYGELLWWTNNLPGAREAHGRALSIREELSAQDAGNAALRHEVALSHKGLGQVFYWNSELAEALNEYERARVIFERVAAENPQSVEYRGDVGAIYADIGEALYWDNKLEQARESQRRAISLLEPLAREHPTDARPKRRLMSAYMKLGSSFMETQVREALDTFRRALSLAEEIERADPLNVQARRDLALLHRKIGETLVYAGRVSEAVESLRRALPIHERLVAENPRNATAREDLAAINIVVGEALMGTGDASGASDAYRRALEIREALAAEDPGNTGNLRFVADACQHIAEASEKLATHAPASVRAERWLEARGWYERSLKLWRELQSRGQLSAGDVKSLDAAIQHIAGCDAELARL